MAKLRIVQVAISGGGLVGAAIARALYQQHHIQIKIYESTPEVSEKGMVIGLAINAQWAMIKLLPNVEDLLKRAGAVTFKSSRMMLMDCGFIVPVLPIFTVKYAWAMLMRFCKRPVPTLG